MGRTIAYVDGTQALEGYFAPPQNRTPAPGVLIAPTWLGITQSIHQRAERIAAMGYAALALDVFGAGVHPAPPLKPQAVVHSFMSDRLMFRKRLKAGLEVLQQQPECDASPDRRDWVLLWWMRCPRTGTQWCAFAGCSQLSWRIGLANASSTRRNPGKNSRAAWRCRSGCAL